MENNLWGSICDFQQKLRYGSPKKSVKSRIPAPPLKQILQEVHRHQFMS